MLDASVNQQKQNGRSDSTAATTTKCDKKIFKISEAPPIKPKCYVSDIVYAARRSRTWMFQCCVQCHWPPPGPDEHWASLVLIRKRFLKWRAHTASHSAESFECTFQKWMNGVRTWDDFNGADSEKENMNSATKSIRRIAERGNDAQMNTHRWRIMMLRDKSNWRRTISGQAKPKCFSPIRSEYVRRRFRSNHLSHF